MNQRESFYRFALSRLPERALVCDLACGDGSGAGLLASSERTSHCFGFYSWGEFVPDRPKLSLLPRELWAEKRLSHRRFNFVTAYTPFDTQPTNEVGALLGRIAEILLIGGRLLLPVSGERIRELLPLFQTAGLPIAEAVEFPGSPTKFLLCVKAPK